MQNDFEKQVREKMEELKFVPSAPVWDKVEEQIRRKKDRKRAIIWLPLLGMLLAGGIWWLNDAGNAPSFSASHKSASHKKEDHKPAANTTTKNNIRLEKEHPSEKISQPAPENILTQESSNENRSVADPATIRQEENKKSTGTGAPAQTEKKSPANDQQKNSAASTHLPQNRHHPDSRLNPNTPSSETLKPAESRVPVILVEQQKIWPYQPDRKIEQNMETPVRNYRILTERRVVSPVVFQPIVTNVSAAPVAVLPGKKMPKKWELGVAVSAGLSGAKSGLNFLGENKRMDAAPMAASFQPPFSFNNNTDVPKTIRNNFTFSVGVAARKPVSRRFGFSTGILYEYLSTLSSVGVRINQANAVQGSVGNALYYTSYTTKQQEYFNQYHFITLPVSFDYQVLKHKPLRIHAGMSVKQLVRTNALQFNHQSQIYYYNRNAFNRTQLFPGFGMEYAFLKNRSLVVGPLVEGGLIALEKNGSNEHLFTGSVKAQWFFLKK